jgi:hypothetical protein
MTLRIFLPCLALVVMSDCTSLGRGSAEVESEPLSNSYRQFRSKQRLLYIQNFDNRTYSPQLTGRLKEKLQAAFSRNASLTITPDKNKAELILHGKILQYSEEPGVYDRAAGPVTYNLAIVASFRLRARAATETEEAPYEQHTIRYMTAYSVGEPMFETRFTAEDRMLEGLADRMAAAAYEPGRAP